MQSRHKGQEPYLFELIRELFPQDESSEPASPPFRGPKTIGIMILIGVLLLFYGLRWGVFSNP